MQGLQPSVVLAVALAWTATTGEAQIREPFADHVLLPQEVAVAEHTRHQASLLSPAGPVIEPIHIHAPGASFVKVHFSDFNIPQGVLVQVSNPAGTEAYRYSNYARDCYTVDKTRGDDSLRRFSAMSISGDTAIVRVMGFFNRFDPLVHRVDIDSYLAGAPDLEAPPSVSHIEKALGPSKSKPEFACGADERYDSVCWDSSYPDQYDRARPVALLITARGFQCTAWRVGEDNRLFTAEHCISDQAELEGTEIWFNYQAEQCDWDTNMQEVKVAGDRFLASDRTLDYTLFTVHDFDSIAGFGNLGLDVRNGKVGENIFIPQHGLGMPQQMSIESDMNLSGLCEIDDGDLDAYGEGTDIGYYCDTTTSSSGSPVVSGETGKVIALHHLGGCLNMGAKVSLIWPQVSEHFGGKVPEGDSEADWKPGNELPEASYLANCDKLSCNFDAVDSVDYDGTITGYHWDFGDGTDSSGPVVEHEFTEQGEFDVSLTVEDDEGATDTYTTQVSVVKPNQAPNAKFSAACVNNRCTLNGSGSDDPDGEIEHWSWGFGDGAESTGLQAEHVYSESGSYTITLTVTDNEGVEGRTSHNVQVSMPNEAPHAAFTFECTKQTCSFDGSTSGDNDGEITEYSWDLGDGNTATGMSFEHSYSQNGSYTVTLTVHDNLGKFNTAEKTLAVDGVNVAPKARFTVSCDGLTCVLDGSGSVDDDGKIDRYQWALGDGAWISGSRITHKFPDDGTYLIKLTVTDNEGANGSRSQTVKVEAPAEIRLAASSSVAGKGAAAYLKWDGAESDTVRILRNGKHIAEAVNKGRYLDASMKTGHKSARYQVCESGSDLCSNVVAVQAGI